MKALVTGGAGFIGSNLVTLLLKESLDVVIFDNLSTGYRENIPQSPGVTFREGDIRNRKALEEAARGCEVVFHLAANVGNIRSIEDPCMDSDINVLGTLHVLEVARRWKIHTVIFSSSAAILGEVRELPQTEGHPTDPDSPYGVSKLAAEKQCICYDKLYGIRTVCLRYFNVYGPNQRYDAYGNVIPIFAARLKEGKPLIIYGDGGQTRDFVFVEDVARANLLAATQPEARGPFHIGSGAQTTINQLASLCQELFPNGKSPIEYDPPRKGEIRHSVADVSKARKILGFTPRVSLKKGLEQYFQWLATL